MAVTEAATNTAEQTRAPDSLWNPQAHMPTVLESGRLTFVSGDGAYLTTSQGRRMLDATAGLYLANVGHGRREIADAIHRQLLKLENYHIFGNFATDIALELSDKLACMSPIPDAKVFYSSGGSDSVEIACKLARRYWQVRGKQNKKVILSRNNAYHGLHAFGTSICGLPYNREGYGTESLVPDVAQIPTNDLDGARETIEQVGPENVAAILAEPVIGTGGIIGPSPGYLRGLQQLCREHDILFIADEVITGFGRTGFMFGSQKFGIIPDMVLLAKGITSGYAPLGAVLIGPKVWSEFYGYKTAPIFRHGLTYAGHSASCAAALANIGIIERDGLVPRVRQLIDVLTKAVSPLAAHELVQEVRTGAALLAGVQIVPDVPAQEIADRCIAQDVIVRAIHGNVLQISPPFIVDESEIKLIADVVKRNLDASAQEHPISSS